MKKRVLSMFLALALCLTLLPAAAFAEGGTGIEPGDLTSESGSISGNGTIGGETGSGTGGGIYTPPGSPTEGSGGVYTPAEGSGSAATPEDAAAQIDETYYSSLPEALDAAQDGDTVKLLKDHTADSEDVSTVPIVKNTLTLNLNGFKIDMLAVGLTEDLNTGDELATPLSGNLTIVDNSTGGAGSVTDTLQLMSGTLNIQGGVIGHSDATGGPAGSLECDSGTVTISGGTVFGITVYEGASVTVSGGSMHKGNWSNSGTLTIEGGTFDSVWFCNNGGTIAIRGGTFGKITNTNASSTIPVMSLLAEGYAFYADDTVQDGTATSLNSVTVKEHTDHTFVNGTCTVCGAVTCDSKGLNGKEGACIAHVTAYGYTWHFKTLQELAGYIYNWVLQDYSSVTVEFLSDVTVTETLTFSQCNTHVILDLNGHTISGNLDEAPVIETNFGYGGGTAEDGTLIRHCIAFQNGAIKNTGSGAALKLSNGAATLTDVDVEGDMSLTNTFATAENYIPTFLGGGSFTKICVLPDGSWQKLLEHMLPKGYYFADITTHKRVSQYALTIDQPLENVTVLPCKHKDGNGKSTFTDRHTDGYYYCSICGNLCPHKSMTPNVDGSMHCNDCTLDLAATATKRGVTTYYIKLSDAFSTSTTGALLKPLHDQTFTHLLLTYNGGYTIDLNGCTVTTQSASAPYIPDYTVTFQNSAEKPGSFVCNHIDVYGGGTLAVPAENNNLTISSVLFKQTGNGKLAGGSFGKITVESGKTLASLLVSGYCFADSTSGKGVALYDADGNALTELADVTVRPCSHTEAVPGSNGTWVCPCGQTIFTASVTTADGKTTCYTDLFAALDAAKAASGSTLTLLDNVTLLSESEDEDKSSIYIYSGDYGATCSFTIDWNGHTLSGNTWKALLTFSGNTTVTLKDSSGSNSGGVRNLFGGGNTAVQIAVDSPACVTIEGGTYSAHVVMQQRCNGDARISGGVFENPEGAATRGALYNNNGNLADLLAEGYTFAFDAEGKSLLNVYDENNSPNATTIYVVKHDHNYSSTDGKCACGAVCAHSNVVGNVCQTCKMTFAASVTTRGKVTYYGALSEAIKNAGAGSTVTLLADENLDITVDTGKSFTLDLNGHSIFSLTVNSKITIKDSAEIKGEITEKLIVSTDLTIGDLLEEGYAFRNPNGTWYPEYYKNTQNASVQPVPIRSVTAVNPTVTVEYGKTSEITLTASAVLTDEGTPISYQWYEAGGSLIEITGATNSSYPLPADLSAGEHTFRLTATADGYEKSCEFTVNVTPLGIAGAEVTASTLTYNGESQTPTVTVKLGSKTLTENKDYTVTATAQTDAGSYKLTVNGRGGYTGTITDVDWTIEPFKIKNVTVSGDISKVYDGMADITKSADEWEKLLQFNYSPAAGSADVPDTAYTISDAKFVDADGKDSPDAGDKYGITFKITLKSSNYVLQGEDGEASATSKEYTQTGGANFTITQDTLSLAAIRQEYYVYNDLEKTYALELQPMLDYILSSQKSVFCKYGTITYPDALAINLPTSYYGAGGAKIDGSNLMLRIKAANTGLGEIGTVTVKVNSTNYQTFDLIIHICAQNKLVPVLNGTVSASDITYGQSLADSTLTVTGSMLCPRMRTPITGTFSWTDSTVKPDAGSYAAEWTFTPGEGFEEYAVATGTVTVTVNRAAPAFTSPTAKSLSYNTKEQPLLTPGSTQDGTMLYRLGDSGEFVDTIPTGKDAGTYTVYYMVKGDSNHTDTNAVAINVTIQPMALLRFVSTDPVTKTYDGTANAPLTAGAVTFHSKTMTSGFALPDDAFTIANARFTKPDADGESYVDSPEVGNGKSLSFTVTLTSDNYMFEESGTKDRKTIQCDNTTNAANKYTITKAAAPSVSGGHPAVTVINGLAKTYELELTEALLPKLSDPCKYGSISYSWKGSYLTDGYEKSTVEVVEENGQYKLKLIVPAVDYDKEASSGTIDITVVSDNYADFTLSIGLKTRNKAIPVPDGTISASEITYGQPLSASTITGRMKHPDTGAEITGTFSWEDGTLQFDAGDREANWIFTPDEPEYAAATGTVTVKVNPKSIEGATVTLEDTFEYDGTEKEPKIISVVLDGVPLTGPGQDKDYGYSYDRATNAGTYPLVIGGQNNYTGRLTFTWTLKAREVTPTITVADGIYNGGAPVEPAVTLTDDLDNTISETEYSVSYTNNTNAGTGTVTITDKAGGNYALGTASKDFNIAKAASEVTAAPTANTLTYNGENQALVTAGTANGGTMVYSLSKTGGYSNQIPTGKDAATYTVYYKVSGDDNHNDTAPQRVTVTIQKASVTVTAENKSTRVGYALSELTYTCVPAPFAGDAFTGALACSADKDTVGTSEITQGTLSLGDNYTITFVKGTYTVEKKLLQNEFRFSDSARTATYGDADFTLAAVGAAEGSTVTYSSTNERVAVVDDNGLVHILKAGETTITAVASETADYARGIASCTLVVAPKTLTSRDLEWTGGALTKVYDGTTAADGITVAVKASSLVGTDTLSITGSAVYNSADVDKASEIRFTPNAITEGNYRLAASEVLTISGASITQATPSYTAPSGLTATYGQTLSDVHLPGGWSWENSSTSVGGASASAKTFKATFTPDDTINYKTVTGIDVALLVNKAAGGSLGETALSQKYTDEQEHFFEADWSGLPEGQSWIFGSMYRRGEGSNAQLPRLENTVDGSKLVYVISGGKTGDTVTITFQASCENYETFTITLRITLRDRDAQAALTVTGADTVVYGQTLTLGVSGGSGTGAVTFSVKNETGEAGIDPDSGVLTPVKVGSVTVTATKAGDSEYNEAVSAPFTVTITKAASTGEPGYTRITTGGKTLADANLTLTGSTLNPNAGTLEWVDGDGNVLPGQTKVEANKRYKWRFTPADGNYDVLTGEIELYHVYIGGSTASVITVPVSSEQETVKVDAEVSGSTASVKITDRQLEQVISDGETVTVDVSGLKNVDSAKLPASAVEKIEQSGAELTVRMPNGSVSLDAKALAALGNAGDVTVSIRQAALTNAQQESIGKRAQVAAAVDVDVTAGRVKQDSFGGGRLTVSIPYTPKSGEDVSQLTVWLIRDDGSTENLGGQYDAKTGCFVFQTGRSARYLLVNAAGAQQFADVPASAYFADAVAWAQENGITNGIGSGLFGVNAPCTRAQAVTFLWRAAGSPAPETAVMPFTDVPVDSYYYSAVLWAVENGIAKGTSSTTFGPGASCTRAQIVTFLYRAFGSPADSSVAFADIAPNAYYADAVRWAVAAGVTTGTSRTAFSPNADCTRAQIVTFLWRCKK